MNKPIVRSFLAGLVVILVSLACTLGPLLAPAASPSLISPPTLPSATQALPTERPPEPTLEPVLSATDTPAPADMDSFLKSLGFERDKTLDTGCNTPCSAYNQPALKVLADFYYTNKSFSLLYYYQDPNGQTEQTEAALVAKVLAGLYPGSLSNDVMAVANDYEKNIGVSRGISGNFIWTVSIDATYNLDKSVKQIRFYIGVTPG
jgi:hypothetical protein